MVDCYRKQDCSVKSDCSCRARFAGDHCPNSLGGDDDEMQFSPSGDVPEQKLDGLYSDGPQ